VGAVATRTHTEAAVERLEVSAYTVPTDQPQQDGSFDWDSRTIVVCEAHAGDQVGLGYSSGGFTSYSLDRIRNQLGGWVAEGIPRVTMKVGRDPSQDASRVDAARDAVGEAALFVDANGAFTRKQALAWAHQFRDIWDVAWFEKPVSSDDLEGLRLLRDRGPGGLDVAAGEYGYVLPEFAAGGRGRLPCPCREPAARRRAQARRRRTGAGPVAARTRAPAQTG
jgi:L-alanine-DL-glutamate epimerase-like enolase superfamily enzyme